MVTANRPGLEPGSQRKAVLDVIIRPIQLCVCLLKVVLIHWSGIHLCEEKVARGFPSPAMVQVFTPWGGDVALDVSTRGGGANLQSLTLTLCSPDHSQWAGLHVYLNMIRVVNNWFLFYFWSLRLNKLAFLNLSHSFSSESSDASHIHKQCIWLCWYEIYDKLQFCFYQYCRKMLPYSVSPYPEAIYHRTLSASTFQIQVLSCCRISERTHSAEAAAL